MRSAFLKLCNIGDELADQRLQELGKEAQLAVGISEKECLPIRQLNPGIINTSAIAEPHAIYVSEQSLNGLNYGSNVALCFMKPFT